MSTRLEELTKSKDTIDYFSKADEDYSHFNENSWRKGMGYVMPPECFPIFNEHMEGLESGLFLVAGEANCGKALALDTPILKSNGEWMTIGNIKVGDYVWGDDGIPALVIAKSEVFKDHRCYQITCDDGTTLNADANHVWKVYSCCAHKSVNKEYIKSTEQLAEDYFVYHEDKKCSCYRYKIPMQAAIEYPEKQLPIPPYILGVWLSNGSNKISVCIDDYEEALKQLDLVQSKYIPEQYLHSSVQQRRELLQGLIDADGFICNDLCEFTQPQDSPIVKNFGELLSSLGIKWNVTEEEIVSDGKTSFVQQFLFAISKDNLKDESFLYKTITDIKLIDTIPTQCIQVLNSSHCYLVGSNLTVTHNTALMQEIILRYASNPDNKLVGLYFSLDDTADKIIPRLLAGHSQLLGEQEPGVPISLYSKPLRYLNKLKQIDLESDEAHVLYSYLYDDITAGGILIPDIINTDPEDYDTSVRHRGYSWLRETEEFFHIVDGTTIHNGEQLIEFCNDFKTYVQRVKGDIDYNIIVGIDSFSDIRWESQGFGSDKELNDYTSSRMKALAVEELKCPVFGTIHLRKIDQKKRPTIADVKESGRWAYEASLVFLVHNDVSRNGEAAGIFGTTDDSDFKLPVLEILWAKNKQSSFKGRTYCYFKTNYSRVWECGKEATERFNSLLYSL